jgi:hypothetical protein
VSFFHISGLSFNNSVRAIVHTIDEESGGKFTIENY